jgi:hypothetical protein
MSAWRASAASVSACARPVSAVARRVPSSRAVRSAFAARVAASSLAESSVCNVVWITARSRAEERASSARIVFTSETDESARRRRADDDLVERRASAVPDDGRARPESPGGGAGDRRMLLPLSSSSASPESTLIGVRRLLALALREVRRRKSEWPRERDDDLRARISFTSGSRRKASSGDGRVSASRRAATDSAAGSAVLFPVAGQLLIGHIVLRSSVMGIYVYLGFLEGARLGSPEWVELVGGVDWDMAGQGWKEVAGGAEAWTLYPLPNGLAATRRAAAWSPRAQAA